MSPVFVLEELDPDTRAYLLAVRDRAGRDMPGVYAPLGNPWPGIGCVVGPVLVGVTLLLTLTDTANVIYHDPNRVALLQTAGLVVGGWMAVAAVRVWAIKRGPRTAGYWAYADVVNLYEAQAECVTVSSLDDLQGARYKHTYSENRYQQTTVTVMFSAARTRTLTIPGEEAAEVFVAFLNYLTYAYGPDGGTRPALPAASLGALGAYVARTENEPVDAQGNPDAGRAPLDWAGEVPEHPERVGRAAPVVLPYILLLLAGAGCYFLMRSIDVRLRDNAIFAAVTTDPIEPQYLRAYLIDPRNTHNRDAVLRQLAAFYDPVVDRLRQRPVGGPARDGLIQVLQSVRAAEQAVVSVRVTEAKPPAGDEDGAAMRTRVLREAVSYRTGQALTPLSRPILIPPGVEITPPPQPVGEQLLNFVAAPEDAANPHFDIRYSFEPQPDGRFRVGCRVQFRVVVEDAPVATDDFTMPRLYGLVDVDKAATDLAAEIVRRMTGAPNDLPAQPQIAPAVPAPAFD